MAVLVRMAVTGMAVRLRRLTVGPGLRLERRGLLGDDEVHAAQHVGQHRIRLELEPVGLQFQRDVAVAQVVGRAQQVERRAVLRAGAHHHHGLRRGLDADQRAVLGDEHVAAAHRGAARQEHAQRAALRVLRVEAALLAGVPVQRDDGGALEQRGREAAAPRNELVDGEHRAKARRVGRAEGRSLT